MTEAEALDEAARAAGWRDWKTLQLIARPDKQDDIRRHAKTIMENAALKAENERLRMSKRCLRLGLYGLMDSHDADAIATTIEAGGVVSWDKYPPSARAALKEIDNGDR